MSEQIYWAVLRRTNVKTKKWPIIFYKQATMANRLSFKENVEWSRKHPDLSYEKRPYYVKRYIMKTADATHYDIYEHERKIVHN